MRVALVDERRGNLIGEYTHVVLGGQIGLSQHFIARQYLADRVVRVAQHEGMAAVRERLLNGVENEQPYILFCISGDDSRESFGAYGGRNCNTPAIDALASEGVVFTNAYTQNPKSAPSRACILTGKYSWQLKEATNHFPHFPAEFTLYPQVLMENGYYVGSTGKGWGPGTYDTKDNPAGPEYNKLTVKD